MGASFYTDACCRSPCMLFMGEYRSHIAFYEPSCFQYVGRCRTISLEIDKLTCSDRGVGGC